MAFFFPLYSELNCEIDIRWIGIVMEEEYVEFRFYNDFVPNEALHLLYWNRLQLGAHLPLFLHEYKLCSTS
jgi:hypothetical protein